MLESIRLWARYNLATDEKVNALLATLSEDDYVKERVTYFKSLAGLHFHYIETYGVYQKLIRKNTRGRHFVSPLTEETYEFKVGNREVNGAMALELDRQYLAFTQIVTEAELEGPKFPRTMRNGKIYNFSVGEILTQYQNHTAHHRGQLSQLLDELGATHDIGGLLVYGEEVKG